MIKGPRTPSKRAPARSRGSAATALALLVGLAITTPSSARADEGERIFSIYGGVATFASGVGSGEEDTASGVGAQIGIDYERGLTRAVWFRASAGGALYTGRPTSASGQATAGLTYVFDVFKYVPYAHIGLGGAAIYLDRTPEADDADNGTELHPLVELGLGLDVLSKDDFSYGFHLRFQSFLDRTALALGGVRISWRWGFF